MIVHMKKFFIVIPIIIFLLLASADVYFYFFRKNLQSSLESQTSHPPCLSDNETVDYTINWRQDVTPVDIIIKDKKSGNEISRFSINSILPVYYPVQPRKCGVYVLRVFNYNPEINKQAPGYRDEIWKYDYSGKGEPLLLLSEKPKEFISYYSLVFQVDPREIYIALVRGYLEREDYALVIKDLNRVSEEIKEESKLSNEEWRKYFTGHWNFAGCKQDKHIAMFPEELPRRLIRMFSFVGETVLDPFLGSGTTSKVAKELKRNSIGYEINKDFLPIIEEKIGKSKLSLFNQKDIIKVVYISEDENNHSKQVEKYKVNNIKAINNRIRHPEYWKTLKNESF